MWAVGAGDLLLRETWIPGEHVLQSGPAARGGALGALKDGRAVGLY